MEFPDLHEFPKCHPPSPYGKPAVVVKIGDGILPKGLKLRAVGWLEQAGFEEWEPACYQLPSHRLQIAHGVTGAKLMEFIKAWVEDEGKKDQDILEAAVNPRPNWPWPTIAVFEARFAEAKRWQNKKPHAH